MDEGFGRRFRLELVHACCDSNAVYVVIADTVAAYREFCLTPPDVELFDKRLFFYLPLTFQYVEDRLGKHTSQFPPNFPGLGNNPRCRRADIQWLTAF